MLCEDVKAPPFWLPAEPYSASNRRTASLELCDDVEGFLVKNLVSDAKSVPMILDSIYTLLDSQYVQIKGSPDHIRKRRRTVIGQTPPQ